MIKTYANNKIILDLCGGTGSWSKPYKDNGYEVYNITLPNYNVEETILNWNCIEFIGDDDYKCVYLKNIYGILAAPPCTQFSFARTNAKEKRNLQNGMKVVNSCLNIIFHCQYLINKDTQKYSPLKFWALENPNGMLKWFLGKPVLEFDPWEYGDMYKKKTHLWGWFNIPKKINAIKPDVCKFDKMKTKDIHSEYYGKYNRQTRRAITPQGFAQAFYEANK